PTGRKIRHCGEFSCPFFAATRGTFVYVRGHPTSEPPSMVPRIGRLLALPGPLGIALALPLAALACAGPGALDPDLDLAEGETHEPGPASDGRSPTWHAAPTLHLGEAIADHAEAGGRRVHALWAAGSPEAPVVLEVAVQSADAADVRVAVLGPLTGDGEREVIAAAGYAERTRRAEVIAELSATGQHLVVVGAFRLESDASYTVTARCAPGAGEGCAPGRVDLLATPKAGALVGEDLGGESLLRGELGAVLADRAFDLELELWASPPAQPWNAELVAVSVASGAQVNALVPGSVAPGDDLVLVAREAGGEVLDTGVAVRFAPDAQEMARLDSVLYGDLGSLVVSGVIGYSEGVAELALRSETYGHEIRRVVLRAERPGQPGNGLGAFDATFAPDLADHDGIPDPQPRNGE